MNLPYDEKLEIEYLGRLFDNKSESYKLFWFKAIVEKVLEGKEVISYEELIDEMVAEAWYMVNEYHLNLGPKDTLEALVDLVKKQSGLKNSEEKGEIIDYLRNCKDSEILKKKRTLTYNVPYRLQAPFIHNLKGKDWDVGAGALIEKINLEKRLIYYFEALDGLNTKIVIKPDWAIYIHKNQEIIKGWIHFNMITYLQRRNPSVPGISDKLYPPQERKLEKIKKYWKLILEKATIHEIYNNETITTANMSIDHFVPWSYVAHDELWNLHPTTKSINSSKSNNLPKWDKYFSKLAQIEFFSYEMIWKYEDVKAEFEKCAKEHLNNDDIRRRIYSENMDKGAFYKNLEDVVKPVYQSAVNCGFGGEWVYGG